MSKNKYAIYDMYSFETTCDDSPRGSQGPYVSILVKLTHDEVMQMGKWFKEERPYLMEYEYSMDYIDRVRNKLVREKRYSEEESWKFQVVWSDDLVYDCENYYERHRLHVYVIDGYYNFGTVTDCARPSSCGGNELHLHFGLRQKATLGSLASLKSLYSEKENKLCLISDVVIGQIKTNQ